MSCWFYTPLFTNSTPRDAYRSEALYLTSVSSHQQTTTTSTTIHPPSQSQTLRDQEAISTGAMLQDFQYRHIPALYAASAQLWATVWPLVAGGGARSVMLHYGLPARVADVPEAWPAWNAGNARTACTGILMYIFYARGQYEVLDTFLVVLGAYLGVADFIVLSNEGLFGQGLFRMLSSFGVSAIGLAGVTQGPASQ